MRLSPGSLFVALAVLAAGCAHTPIGFTSRAAPGVTVVASDEARRAELDGRPFMVAFADGDDRDAVVAHFLNAVRREGASFVSDIALATMGVRDGSFQRCITRVVPVDHGSEQVVSVWVPEHYRDEVHYETVVVQHPSTRTECSGGGGGGGGGSDKLHTPPPQPHCETHTISESQTESRAVHESIFVPGHFEERRKWVEDWKLDALPTACAPIDATTPTNMVTGTIYASR